MQTVQHLPMLGFCFAPTFLSFASAKVEHSSETTKHSACFFQKNSFSSFFPVFRGFFRGISPKQQLLGLRIYKIVFLFGTLFLADCGLGISLCTFQIEHPTGFCILFSKTTPSLFICSPHARQLSSDASNKHRPAGQRAHRAMTRHV